MEKHTVFSDLRLCNDLKLQKMTIFRLLMKGLKQTRLINLENTHLHDLDAVLMKTAC